MTAHRLWSLLDDVRRDLATSSANPQHANRVLRLWSQHLPQDSGRRRLEDFLPRPLRNALPDIVAGLREIATLQSQHPAGDGSARLLVRLADGETIESVLLPPDGVCVSTQVGCAVGCVFCMTGQGGLTRQLGSAEIVAQVALARSLQPVRKVVFMGMGEPAHNLDNVLEAIAFLATQGGVGHKNLVFSTVGDRRVFERFAGSAVKPALALSLHSTDAARRAALLPRAPRLTPAELVSLSGDYAASTGYPTQFQWTLIEGVNDGDDEIAGLVKLLTGQHAILNLIPFNPVAGAAYRRPSTEKVVAMTRALNRQGILTRIRRSAGQDVDAGCGQLRSRSAALTPP